MRVAGIPAAIAAAMIAPVEVPATNEKVSRVSRPVMFSSLARATAGMMPRIPPPSIDNNLRRGISPPPACAGRSPPPINKYEANRSSVHLPHRSKAVGPRGVDAPKVRLKAEKSKRIRRKEILQTSVSQTTLLAQTQPGSKKDRFRNTLLW